MSLLIGPVPLGCCLTRHGGLFALGSASVALSRLFERVERATSTLVGVKVVEDRIYQFLRRTRVDVVCEELCVSNATCRSHVGRHLRHKSTATFLQSRLQIQGLFSFDNRQSTSTHSTRQFTFVFTHQDERCRKNLHRESIPTRIRKRREKIVQLNCMTECILVTKGSVPGCHLRQ